MKTKIPWRNWILFVLIAMVMPLAIPVSIWLNEHWLKEEYAQSLSKTGGESIVKLEVFAENQIVFDAPEDLRQINLDFHQSWPMTIQSSRRWIEGRLTYASGRQVNIQVLEVPQDPAVIAIRPIDFYHEQRNVRLSDPLPAKWRAMSERGSVPPVPDR